MPDLLMLLTGGLGAGVGFGLDRLSLWLGREPGEASPPGSVRRTLLIVALAVMVGVVAGWPGRGGWVIAATALLGWQLLLIAVVDAENFWLPDALTLPLGATGLAAAAWLARGVPWAQIAGAALGFGLLALMAWLYGRVRGRRVLGGGDPILLGAIGAWVGWTGLPTVMLWAAGAALLTLAGRAVLRRPVGERLPFGALLAIGGWLTWLMGPLGR